MLRFLASLFLSFTVVSSSGATVLLADPAFSVNDDYLNNVPKLNVNYNAIETGLEHNYGIGRHKMLKINSVDYMGVTFLDQLTYWLNPNDCKDVIIERNITTITETTISFTETVSSEVAYSVGINLGWDIVSMDFTKTMSKSYEIEKQETYSYTVIQEFKLGFVINYDTVANRTFALGLVGHTYKITYETWSWDDFWWGDYEVSGSRRIETAYLSIDPCITLIYA